MGVIFFFPHHQAQLKGDRDYGAEYSTCFLDSIAIVVVKCTLMELCVCVHPTANFITVHTLSKKMPARHKEWK